MFMKQENAYGGKIENKSETEKSNFKTENPKIRIGKSERN